MTLEFVDQAVVVGNVIVWVSKLQAAPAVAPTSPLLAKLSTLDLTSYWAKLPLSVPNLNVICWPLKFKVNPELAKIVNEK